MSLEFPGLAWPLLLLLPVLGLWLARFRHRGAGRRGKAMLLLQAGALVLLCAGLLEPALVRVQNVYHSSLVGVFTDQSGSYDGGRTLGAGGQVAAARDSLVRHYRAAGCEVREYLFDDRVRPAGADAFAVQGQVRRTDLGAVLRFVRDSMPPNLQAAFLFTDGRPGTWPPAGSAALEALAGLPQGRSGAALFPVLPPGVTGDRQLIGVALTPGAEGRFQAAVEWEVPRGWTGQLRLDFSCGGRRLVSVPLPVVPRGGQTVANLEVLGAGGWECPEGLSARIYGETAGDPNPWNDEVAVVMAGKGRGIVVRFPVPPVSPDERWLMDRLSSLDSFQVVLGSPSASGLGEQVWAPESAWKGSAGQTLLRGSGVAVAYPNPYGPVAGGEEKFGPAAVLAASRAEGPLSALTGTRLGEIAGEPLWLPPATAGGCLLEVRESGQAGCLLRRERREGRDLLHLAWKSYWTRLFQPPGAEAAGKRAEELIAMIAEQAREGMGEVRVEPASVCAGTPFVFRMRIRPEQVPATGLRLAVAGSEGRSEVALQREYAGEGWEFLTSDSLTLEAGTKALSLPIPGSAAWKGRLEVVPGEKAELGRTGCDTVVLGAWAARSGGQLLHLGSAGPAPREGWPALAAGETAERREQRVPLYNTVWMLLLALGLLGTSWGLGAREG